MELSHQNLLIPAQQTGTQCPSVTHRTLRKTAQTVGSRLIEGEIWLYRLRNYQLWYVDFPLWNYLSCYHLLSVFRNVAFWAVRPHILPNNYIFGRICLSNYTASHSTGLSNSRPLWNIKYYSCLYLLCVN